MALPSVLFSSSSSVFKPCEFVKNILRVAELPEAKELSDNIKSYEWSFDTKYYSSTVSLCTTENRTIGDEVFANSVQAFVHFFDPQLPSSFELAKAWLPYLKHIEPEILMLVCTASRNSDAVSRRHVLEWCIHNKFELVELDPEGDSDSEEDDFPETTGMARIVQALHAHTWPNLQLKNSPTVQSPYFRNMMREQHILNQQLLASASHPTGQEPKLTGCPIPVPVNFSSAPEQCLSNSNGTIQSSGKCGDNHSCEVSSSRVEQLNSASLREPVSFSCTDDPSVNCPTLNQVTPSVSEMSDQNTTSPGLAAETSEDLFQLENTDWRALLGQDGQGDTPTSESSAGVEEFEQLFLKLKVMKDKADSLPDEERKKYAEKVAISFWKAIGGTEDEIEGLDDDLDGLSTLVGPGE